MFFQKKTLSKGFSTFFVKGLDFFRFIGYNNRAVKTATVKYRGVEQSVARRAHNPEAAGSSPASATRKNTLNFCWVYFLVAMKRT